MLALASCITVSELFNLYDFYFICIYDKKDYLFYQTDVGIK